MSPAIAAHVRLLERTPRERIRTHERVFAPQPLQGQKYPNGQIPDDLVREYGSLVAKGYGYTYIRDALKVGTLTMRKLKTEAAK